MMHEKALGEQVGGRGVGGADVGGGRAEAGGGGADVGRAGGFGAGGAGGVVAPDGLLAPVGTDGIVAAVARVSPGRAARLRRLLGSPVRARGMTRTSPDAADNDFLTDIMAAGPVAAREAGAKGGGAAADQCPARVGWAEVPGAGVVADEDDLIDAADRVGVVIVPDEPSPGALASLRDMPLVAIGPGSIQHLDPVPDQHCTAHLRTLEAMETYGGGFVKAIAAAWRRADSWNHAKLYRAFRTYYREYARK